MENLRGHLRIQIIILEVYILGLSLYVHRLSIVNLPLCQIKCSSLPIVDNEALRKLLDLWIASRTTTLGVLVEAKPILVAIDSVNTNSH